MALIFGTTWMVNSVVISGVLIMILLGNFVASRVRFRKLHGIFAALVASLILNYVFPFQMLLSLNAPERALIAGAIMSLPILFASLLFILTFARTSHSHAALGSNLFGAILGGMCECASFVVGLNALGIIAIVFYCGSFFSLWRRDEVRLRG